MIQYILNFPIRRVIGEISNNTKVEIEKNLDKDLYQWYIKRKKYGFRVDSDHITRKYQMIYNKKELQYIFRSLSRKLKKAEKLEKEEQIKQTKQILNNYKKLLIEKYHL